MAQKIQFTVIVFFENQSFRPAKYRTVTNLASIFRYCDSRARVSSMNIYRKRTHEFMKQVKTLTECYDFYNSLNSKFE